MTKEHLETVKRLVEDGASVKAASRQIGINYKTIIARIKKDKAFTLPKQGRPCQDPYVRFFSKTKKVGDCLEWQGGFKNSDGYGAFRLNGRSINASRAAYILSKGDIPNGLIVCHKCDNPACVNIDHLFLGTSYTNYWDAVHKGRQPMPRFAKYSPDADVKDAIFSGG